MKAVLLSVLISCAFAPQTLAQQIPSSAISAKPNSSKTTQKKTAPTKSWSNPKLRISLPTSATKFKFSKDGKTLFTNGANERSAELWDLTSGKRISAWSATPSFTFCDVALSPDGQFAAGLMYSGNAPTSTKRNIELLVWNLKTGQSRWARPIQNHPIQSTDTPLCQVEFSPNSRLLATSISGMSNKLQSGVRIWNVLQGTLQQVTPMAVVAGIYPNGNRFAFSPDSSVLGVVTLVNGNSQLHLWNLSARKLQAKLQSVHEGNLLSISDIVFSPNQQDVIVFSSDGGIFSYIHRWQIKTGKLQRSLRLTIDRTASLLALSPDSQTYVYGSDVIGYYIGNFQTNRSFPFPQALSPTFSSTRVVFSPDGQQMAIENNDQTIKVIH
ncbi:MAG TPA: WD40 repeat domain-containing protein [Oculatellaceae cyanobacterium]